VTLTSPSDNTCCSLPDVKGFKVLKCPSRSLKVIGTLVLATFDRPRMVSYKSSMSLSLLFSDILSLICQNLKMPHEHTPFGEG